MSKVLMNKYTLILVATAVAFSAGRFSAPKAKVEEKKSQAVDTHETIVVVKRPDGSSTTSTVIDSHRKTDSQTITTPQKAGGLTISALIAMQSADRGFRPLYGMEISKQVLLNTRIGIFGLTDGTVGISLGLDF